MKHTIKYSHTYKNKIPTTKILPHRATFPNAANLPASVSVCNIGVVGDYKNKLYVKNKLPKKEENKNIEI